MTTKVAVVGASGTMGKLIIRLIEESDDFEVFATIGSRDPLTDMVGADIVVDVTLPAVSQDIVEFAVSNELNVLVGTSGWTSERITKLERLVEDAPDVGVIIIPNFSVGSVLATFFATLAARFYDSIEIIEAHRALKSDSPSGTAIRTAEQIGRARAAMGPDIAPHADQRARGQQVASVPIHSLRMQGVIARQDVIFGGTGETLTLAHETISEASYEAGILLALRATVEASGVSVGLDSLIDLAPSA